MNKVDFAKTISQLIELQFPEIYRESGAELVAFIKAYYEFLESDTKYSTYLSRNMFTIVDIDETLPDFVAHFKKTYLADLPIKLEVDTPTAVKNIRDFYKSKGSKESLSFLMKLLFNQDADIYHPSKAVLKPSDSKWYQPIYIEVSISDRNVSFVDTQITGAKSGAKAFVEGVVRKSIKGKTFDVLYLSSVLGKFIAGERVSNNGVMKNAPKVRGSLTSIDIELGGRNNKIGDTFNVVTNEGRQGVAKVVETVDATGRVDFKIIDGGWGFTNTQYTDVYVASATVFVDNQNLDFIDYETVSQQIEEIKIIDGADILANASTNGSFIVGKTLSGDSVANGYIISVANTNANGVTSSASANGTIKIATISGSYGDQRGLLLNSNSINLQTGEAITEEASGNINITNIVTAFAPGETIEQLTYKSYGVSISGLGATLDTGTKTVVVSSVAGLLPGQTISIESGDGAFSAGTTISKIDYATSTITLDKYPTISGYVIFTANPYSLLTEYAVGRVVSANSSNISANQMWGTFTTDALVVGKTSGASALPTTITVQPVASGIIAATSNTANTAYVKSISGSFNANKKIRGAKTGAIYTIQSISQTGASRAYLNANTSANAVIYSSDDFSAKGKVIGQNTSCVGIHGNTTPFFFSANAPSTIKTNRTSMVSPPRHANGQIIELSSTITRLAGGHDASFNIASIGEVERGVTLYTELLNSQNISGVQISNISLSGMGSGVGSVSGVDVVNGGSGYTDGSTVTFSGGGYANQTPILPASGRIIAPTGTIIGVTIEYTGHGYYGIPSITVPGGTGAVLTPNMIFGYGLEKSPYASYNSSIADALGSTVQDLGRVSILGRINPGSEYTADPMVRIRNHYVSAYNRRDFILVLASQSNGQFIIGEELVQVVDGYKFVKGVITGFDIGEFGVAKLFVRRKSLGVSINPDIKIEGFSSGGSGTIAYILENPASSVIGDNAIIDASTVSASGVATKVAIIDSGFGYISNDSVQLEATDGENPYIMSGISNSKNQGIGIGHWLSEDSHTNSTSRIHDNHYYQEYSYDIQSGISLDKYENTLKRLFHVSGMVMFGSVVRTARVDAKPVASASTIVKTKPVPTNLVTSNGKNVVTASGLNVIVLKETEI